MSFGFEGSPLVSVHNLVVSGVALLDDSNLLVKKQRLLSMNIDLVRFSGIRLAVMTCLIALSACALPTDFLGQGSAPSAASEAAAIKTRSCEEPRPKICTLRYEPVCAVMESGSITTYPSACNACADVAVTAWRPEPCKE